MAAQAPDYFNQIQTICHKAGVRVVYTPCLPKAAISGATRWLNNTPLIQLGGLQSASLWSLKGPRHICSNHFI
ncbi:MAG: hypothetical protein WC945_09275 [Bacteroidales bacterium]